MVMKTTVEEAGSGGLLNIAQRHKGDTSSVGEILSDEKTPCRED